VGYLGAGQSFADALARFALAYADQTEQDWQGLRKSKHAPPQTKTTTQSK
jgi:hypothetical protein